MLLVGVAAFLILSSVARAQEIDWNETAKEAVETLREYIRIDTTVPPGDVRPSADLLGAILEREGLKVRRYESAPGKVNLYARLESSGEEGSRTAKPILLLHHMDVVPADASRWPVDPFGGELKDGYVWGRGAMDMKGLGTAHLYAFLTLKRQAVPLDRDVIFMAVADEEVGGQLGARWMIENHYPELDPEYVLDEGGFGSRDVYLDGKLVFGISVAEKKIIWLKVRAEGVAGHGSQPHDQNPNDRLVRALARLLSEPFPTAAIPVLEKLKATLGPLKENKFTRAIQNSTISLTTLQSGVGDPVKVNVIPSVAEATLDCRLLPGTDTEAWLLEIQRRLGDPELSVEVVYESDDTIVTPQDTDLYRALEAAIFRHNPGAVVVPTLIPYGTDSNAFRHRGVKSYGLTPMVLSSEIVASMHSDAERVPAGELGKGIRIFYEAIKEVVGTEGSGSTRPGRLFEELQPRKADHRLRVDVPLLVVQHLPTETTTRR
ncbi:MAG: M20/M25/M40 family metallo-hydrolase [Acidobacteriota bacterium]